MTAQKELLKHGWMGKMARNMTRPMLAATLTDKKLKDLHYPVLVSPKLDGIRCRVFPEGAMSRSHKPIPNHYIQKVIKNHPDWQYLDGELTVGDPTAPGCFNRTQSAAMSEAGEPSFLFHVFDSFQFPELAYFERMNRRITVASFLKVVMQKIVNNEQELLEYEQWAVEEGYEGIMVRKIDGRYKFGRSTENEGLLWKLKRMQDAEGVIVGVEALKHNENPSFRNEQGISKRSTAKAGRVDTPYIGKFYVKTLQWGEIKVGTNGGKFLMQNAPRFLGQTVTFTYQSAGMKDSPRIPIFKGFRAD